MHKFSPTTQHHTNLKPPHSLYLSIFLFFLCLCFSIFVFVSVPFSQFECACILHQNYFRNFTLLISSSLYLFLSLLLKNMNPKSPTLLKNHNRLLCRPTHKTKILGIFSLQNWKKNVSLNLWSEYLIEATLFLEILKPHFRNNFTRKKNC